MKGIFVLILIAVLGGGGTLVYRFLPQADGDKTTDDTMLFAAARGPLRVTITENGSLMAKNSEKISAETRRGGKITFLIEEGKRVEEGEVLCRLDTTDLEERKEQLGLEVNKTKADLETAKTELEIQHSDNEGDIEKAKIALSKAEMDLERYRDGDAPKERRKLEIGIKESETKFHRAKKKYEDSEKLLEQDYINKSQVDEDRIDFERSEIELEGARRDLELFEKYTYPMTMTERETAVRDATRAFENAEKRASNKLRQREVAVESQESRLTRLEKQLQETVEEIDKFTIKSPAPGIVIYGDPNQWWARSEIKLGAQIWGGFTLFTIPDLRVMQVQVQIHEADINKIAVDQVATITMDTYPGLVLTGKVAKIASIAGSGNPGNPNPDEIKKFTVDIVLDDTQETTLKPGISAKADIFIEEREDVLYVPIQCVFIEDGVHYCYVKRNGNPVRVEVQPEVSNDSFIQIASGLEEGELVLLYNPTIQDRAAADVKEAEATDVSSPADAASPEPAAPAEGG